MHTDDSWVKALRQQAAIVQSARLDLEDARRTGWKVLRAELALESVEEAYHRLLTDSPRTAVLRHLRERVGAVRA